MSDQWLHHATCLHKSRGVKTRSLTTGATFLSAQGGGLHNHANLYQKSLDVYLNDQVLKTVFMERCAMKTLNTTHQTPNTLNTRY